MSLMSLNNHEETTNITGIIEIITYKNITNGFFVCKIKVKNNKEYVTITGYTPLSLNVGEVITVIGVWYRDTRYGMQFKASNVQITLPKSIQGIQKYLSSGVIKGIGPVYAKYMIDMFGEKTIDIIENNAHELTKIRGISAEKAQKIAQYWQNNLKIKEMMLFLQSHDITVNLATKIYNCYGDCAINILKDNPYVLARSIKGIGFLSADKIAKNLGMKNDDEKRILSGIEYVLNNITSIEGSCAMPINVLIIKSQELLQVDKSLIENAIDQLIISEKIIIQKIINVDIDTNDCHNATLNSDQTQCQGQEIILAFAKTLYFTEKNIATKLMDIAKIGQSIFAQTDMNMYINQLQQKQNITLSIIQKQAILQLQHAKVMVITGGPGTGKSTLINAIIQIVKLLDYSIKLKVAAPTGRAAKRINNANACTIHRMLEFDAIKGQFKYNDTNYLKCDLMILDEASMIDIYIMYSLLKALPRSITLIIVGDVDQLPSIGPGQILRDIIDSQVITTIKLNEIFRQTHYSKIILNAHAINNGNIPNLSSDTTNSDFEFIQAENDIMAIQSIKNIVQKTLNSNDMQVLSPMQKGSVGVKALNLMLQNLINNRNIDESIEYFGTRFFLNDKVMQTENNYDKNVFNGDIGFIIKINVDDQEVIVNFDGIYVTYDISEMDQLSLAYAITIHKSQGSEYHTVVMPCLTQHFVMLNKNLLYTGITRAKKKLILIGQKRAVAMAIKTNKLIARYSMLKNWLKSL